MALPPRTVSARPRAVRDRDRVLGFYAWSGECYPVEPSRHSVFIGRKDSGGPRLDVELADVEVSGTHCVIEFRPDGGFELVDCSKNGSFVNGVRVHSAAVGFRSGDTVTIGRTKLVVLLADGPDFGPGPYSDAVVVAAFRFHKSLRATAEALDGVSFHRVRSVIHNSR